MIKNKLLLFLLPSVLTIAYFIIVLCPEISTKLGGAANFSSFLIALLTYFYVVFTGIMVQQMIKKQQEETRPYIVVDIKMKNHESWLEINNTGKIPALNVTISIKPDIIDVAGKSLSDTILSKSISFFPPGKMIESYIRPSPEFFEMNLPLKYIVNNTYAWKGLKKPVSEDYEINIDFLENSLFQETIKKN